MNRDLRRGTRRFVVRRSLRENVVDNPWAVLGVLFLAAGMLGLPVLWRSSAFSRSAKILLSIAVTAYSLAIVAVICYAFAWAVAAAMPLFVSGAAMVYRG